RGLHLPSANRAALHPVLGDEHLRRGVLGRAAYRVDEGHEDKRDAPVLERHELLVEGHTRPSFILPSSLIIDWFHGGSHVIRTSASATPGTRRIFPLASSAIAGPIPQPGAVSVIATFTLKALSSRFSTSIEYTRPRSTMFTGISGSYTLRSWSHTASGSGAPPSRVAAATEWSAAFSPRASPSFPSILKSPKSVRTV